MQNIYLYSHIYILVPLNKKAPANQETRNNPNFANTECDLIIYTDGACKGNQNVKLHECPAGW